MKKREFELKDITDIKVFVLYVLDHIAYPIDQSSLMNIITASTGEISLDYDEAIRLMAESGHVLYDEVDGVGYYMISELGKMVARELYDTLDKKFLDKSIEIAGRYLSFANSGVRAQSKIEQNADKRYVVSLVAERDGGVIMDVKLTVNSELEANEIKSNFDARPESVYRGLLLSATGRIEYLK